MRGLKTQEGNKFIAFFELVQKEAAKLHSVFFLECGECNDFETEQMDGEDLRGWLIPEKQADQFEREWLKDQPGEEWEPYITWVLWNGEPEKPVIELKQF